MEKGHEKVLAVVYGAIERGRLRKALEDLSGGGELRVLVVAPTQVGRLDWLASDIDEALANASTLAADMAGAVEDLGAVSNAEADIGDTDPVQAIEDALAEFDADRILLVTHVSDEAGWSEKRLFGADLERFGLPVSHLVA